MSHEIDFTDCQTLKKAYSGTNGSKLSIVYNKEIYMLKFPGIAQHNENMSYSNGCVSEYLGCHIYESIGIPVQKTILGTYKIAANNIKLTVACKDFTQPGIVLQDFASLKNQIVDTARNGYGTELAEIENTFDEENVIDQNVLRERFWNMFIVDALIANWDRHNGNWGFLYDTQTDSLSLAPVFDCGSCLYPQAGEQEMYNTLTDQDELYIRLYERPTSAIQINGKRIKYFAFINSMQNHDCTRALKRIYPRINMPIINEIVDNTPYITDLQKHFYKTMLNARYNELTYAYSLAMQSENKTHSPQYIKHHHGLSM